MAVSLWESLGAFPLHADLPLSEEVGSAWLPCSSVHVEGTVRAGDGRASLGPIPFPVKWFPSFPHGLGVSSGGLRAL